MDFNACPGCGATASSGFFGGSFKVFRCSRCLHYYCYKCPGSGDGRRCPECGSDKATEAGQVK
jgi:hypothetical protein